ncbi:O-acyltransferase like protein-like [Nymphalis io]|uniref:O-acyltransferase like protein-like n=1 Tax=Inachis io TaxID=171585 RepID=UPI002167F697|nr:O-acyltransferase like protein-like [Nymphalis io]
MSDECLELTQTGLHEAVPKCNRAQLVIDENTPKQLFDEELYSKVIDHEECRKQVRYLMEPDQLTLLGRFLDAGIRFPRGFFMLSVSDLGNYEQCLNINEEVEDMKIEGKYYFIDIPFNQTFRLPFLNQNTSDITNRKIVGFKSIINEVQEFVAIDPDTLNPENPLILASIKVAVCVPKPCTTQEWISTLLFNVSAIGFEYEEIFCRLPNDKPWITVDYVAIGVFGFLGLITLLSTFYDINHIVIKKRDPKKANIFYRTFSVYTNTRRLLNFAPNSNALNCLDGIRSISMMWVVVGHTFSMYNFNADLTKSLNWLTSGDAVWISTGLFTVDSFFLMAGLLLVYTSVGRMTGVQVLKRLHVFYLNRLLRMFPLLASLVLLEASVFHRVGDGPYWVHVADNVQDCRSFWWSTLLHIQNYVNPDHMCIQHSWYVAIDIQLHIVSPIILFWVLNKKRRYAWSALIAGLLAIVVASTVWNFIKAMPSSNMSLVRLDEQSYYMNNYYVTAWTRGAPFFVGMIAGYVLNIYKGKKIKLNTGFVITSWVIALGMIASCFYMSYVIMQLDWDNQVGDSLFNSFMRIIWSIGLCWIIFACVKGYGGPINWLLSLSLWKLPARISFAMYLYHYPIAFVIAGMQVTPIYFSVGGRIYDFMALFTLSFIVSFVMTVVIDAPFSVLIKILMEGGQRKSQPKIENGADSSKAGPIPDKNVADLERKIANNDHNLTNNIIHLEKNGSSNDKNGAMDRIEVLGETLPSKENSKF